ncbi:MAG: tRNA cyclic N6-threonylcarbamoyladenosine(37) synthase TcdA [Glaciecola sp.]|jgi:tRNA A37 threonylcarbamoyladenosine dehydratase|nr:tRNA cyclic N6-threonylcarbamoyladenosine(37) synthase TcdA [Glaciecola sp.]MDG2100146.1 tRNA cyclic N6-threonylcarbamoyladenosine(37) synthase TcdA [Glaciecola sp.]
MNKQRFGGRFGGVERLYEASGLTKLAQAHFCVVGIGGVGTWVAEGFARSGIGKITLIDIDDICITNTNRQAHALQDTIGQAKVEAMAQRIKQINPDCVVNPIEDFVLPDNVATYITPDMDIIIDATDSISAKAAMIAYCKRNKIRIITIGGAGGQIDPRQVTSGDLAKTTQDPLAAKLRSVLRRDYNFSKNTQRRFGIECIYSTEQLRYPQGDGTVDKQKPISEGAVKLDCETGFGASVAVTATFGFVAVAQAMNKFLGVKG